MNTINKIPEITHLLNGSDYVDVKTVEGKTTLRQFIASMLSYYPWWVLWLYRIRGVLVKILGLYKQEAPESLPLLHPEDVSFVVGESATFSTVRLAKEDHYWVGETPEDKHLRAYFGVFVEPLEGNRKQFHVVTVVHYKHWTGPVYFNLIRPFHHLVVGRMMQAGVHHV
jgi:hypothetical protein